MVPGRFKPAAIKTLSSTSFRIRKTPIGGRRCWYCFFSCFLYSFKALIVKRADSRPLQNTSQTPPYRLKPVANQNSRSEHDSHAREVTSQERKLGTSGLFRYSSWRQWFLHRAQKRDHA